MIGEVLMSEVQNYDTDWQFSATGREPTIRDITGRARISSQGSRENFPIAGRGAGTTRNRGSVWQDVIGR